MVPINEMTQVLSLNKSDKSGEGSSSAVHLKIGEPVSVTSGDLRNARGSVVKVEEETVYIKSKQSPAGLSESLSLYYKQLRKFFEIGDHVKIVAGVEEGQKGMVVKVDGEDISVLANDSERL
ncbi:putative transcription elongation factor SPT5 1 [Carex littledalei]|uniref:Putative transcription elongation factor SPT5 1 n=1 Tax=Carex littledalei TaxID=544730 RepID=A0A833V3Z8_9POAL|nr:putative transcription elongation factor SPT5 1 [Carex littledalei]